MQRGAQGEQAARAIRRNLFLICSSNRLFLETAFCIDHSFAAPWLQCGSEVSGD